MVRHSIYTVMGGYPKELIGNCIDRSFPPGTFGSFLGRGPKDIDKLSGRWNLGEP
jgi:hypothetical protein